MAGRIKKERYHRALSDPRILITPGDPAGVGPDLSLRAFKRFPHLTKATRLLGDPRIWLRSAQRVRFPRHLLEDLLGGKTHASLALPEPGKPSIDGARLAWLALEEAVEFLKNAKDKPCGVLTSPISKEWMRRAGFSYPGHTEFFQDRFSSPHVLMVMSAPRFHVALHTIHVPLRLVPSLLNERRLVEDLKLLSDFLKKVESSPIRIGVCGLNPHAGEGGILGEEDRLIATAVKRAKRFGIKAEGPLPGDSAFFLMRRGNFSGILAVYHDQGLAPFKLLHFHRGVNVTLGLPIVRVSPDHGTAFDLAPKGEGKPDSTISALRLLIQLVGDDPCRS